MKKTVLIVDDHAENIYLLRVLLEGQGMEVIAAQNGREALDRAHTLKPDLIITDILMPVMDGLELCRAIRRSEILRDVPLIFYTATYLEAEDESFARKVGADAFVVKPCEPEKLTALIGEVLDRARRPADEPEEPIEENGNAFKLYNERLIKKLERRMAELEAETKEKNIAQARFRGLYEGSPVAAFTWRKKGDDFVFEDCNKAALALTGGSAARFFGVAAREIYRNRPEVLDDLDLCFKEKSVIKREITSRNFLPGRFLDVHYGFIEPDLVVVQTMDRTEQKRAQEIARQQQEMLTRVFDCLPVMCAYFDHEGRFLKVNEALEKTLGWSFEEIQRLDLLAACYPDPAAHKEALDWMLSGATGWKDFKTQAKYGAVIDTSWTNTRFPDGTYLGVGQDITGRKRMELKLEKDRQELRLLLAEAERSRHALLSLTEDYRTALDASENTLRELRESEERYRLLYRGSPAGVFHYDTRLRLTDCNDRFVSILQSSREQLLGLDLTALRDASVLPALRRALDGQEGFYEGPYRATTSDAEISIALSTAPLRDHKGRVAGGMGIALDITERVRAQRVQNIRLELFEYAVSRSLDELLQKTIDGICALTQSPIGFFHFVEPDQQTLSLQAWSTRTTREFCRAEGKGMHYPITRAGVWTDAFHARKPVIHNDYASLPHRKGLPEGHAAVVRELVAPVTRGGLVVAILGVGNKPADYTEREAEEVSFLADVVWTIAEQKLAAQEIAKLNEELERRVKERTAQLDATNRELEAFSYSVSHDLRAPLRGIDGFSQALLEDYADRALDDTGRGYIARIRRATQNMGLLIDDMLKLSRVTRAAIRFETVNLSAVAEKIIENFRQESPGRHVELFVQSGVMAKGDPYLLEIALLNLLGNAWKFTGKTAAPRVEFGVYVKDGGRVFFVRDNGAGFDMVYAGRLFGAFQRLHSSEEFPGTGIGLATVRRIINRHGGHIWAEGEVGRGATFYFTLP